MELKELLQQRRSAIGNKWLDKIFQSYPGETATFLKQKRNQFANPVGHILRSEVEVILQKFLEEADLEELRTPLGEIVKVRCVQDLSPSQAISFVYLLKETIREELGDSMEDPENLPHLRNIEDRVDRLAGLTFDLYVEYRQQIFDLRIREIKRTGFRLLQKANLISVDGDPETP